MIERIALTLYERNPGWYGNSVGAAKDARAVLESLLEPTEGMVNAGADDYQENSEIRSAFTAMIRSAITGA